MDYKFKITKSICLTITSVQILYLKQNKTDMSLLNCFDIDNINMARKVHEEENVIVFVFIYLRLRC
jgi:hypothetical protein